MPFAVESDARLAFDVGHSAAPLPLMGVPGSGSEIDPHLLPASPWEFLLAAGRATAAIFSPVKEVFDASSQWAVVRWFWALDWGSTAVCLSPAAEQIRNHHRTAFSEALGLASSLLVVEHLAGETLPLGAWRGGPMLVDVDSLVSSGTRPDLLVFYGGPTGATTFVIEAKGNSSSRKHSIQQLRRGIDQVRAIEGPAERIVVGAAAPGPYVTTHAISVPPPTDAEPGGLMTTAQSRAVEMEQRRIAGFAGLSGLGQEGEIVSVPELELDLVGRSFTLPGDSYAAEITMGVDRRVVSYLSEVRSIPELVEARARASEEGSGRTPPQPAAETLHDRGRVSSVAPDGCAISIALR